MAAKKPAKATKAKKTIAKKADSLKKAAPAKKPAVVAKAKPAAEPESSSEARGEADGSAAAEARRRQGATCARYSAFEAGPSGHDDSSQAHDSSETRDTLELERPRHGRRR